MFYDQDHLVITKRVTTDGLSLKIGDDGRPVEKIVLAPMSSKRHFEKRNEVLPNNLKMKIEEIRVSSYAAPKAAPVEIPAEEKAAAKIPKAVPPVAGLPKGVAPLATSPQPVKF